MNEKTKQYVQEITAETKDNGDFAYRRFNKKAFNGLVTAIINDPSYTMPVAKVKNGEMVDVEAVPVSLNFRKYLKGQVEAMGVDKAESSKILTDDYQVKNADGLYELMSASMIEYMNAGNAFDFPTTPDMKATLKVKPTKGSTSKPTESFHPQTRESLGMYITTKKDHKVMKVSSSCPKFLKNKERV